jgi:hypothetical protein
VRANDGAIIVPGLAKQRLRDTARQVQEYEVGRFFGKPRKLTARELAKAWATDGARPYRSSWSEVSMSAIAADSSDSASSMAPCRALSFPRTQRQRSCCAFVL